MTRAQANLLLLAVALIWGSAFVAQAAGMVGVGPLTFTGIRFLLGTAVVAPLAWREWRLLAMRRAQPLPRDALGIGVLGLLLMLGAVFQQIGITSTTVTNAGFLTALYVPLVPLLGWLLLRTPAHWSVWPTSLGCLAGTWLLSGAQSVDLVVGDLWVMASSVFWALHVIFVGRIAERLHAPFLIAAGQFLVCGLLSLLCAAPSETLTRDGLALAALPIAYAGLVSVGIGYTTQVVAQRYAQPADAAIILSAETVFAAMFGFLLMGDRLNAEGIAGCVLILVCIVAVQIAPLTAAGRRALAARRAQ
ncbi:DMT family transporter [Accumulibacter sp.]|uniref:DMT family transporter n=1 Tax=Accumulibacter sp. TaxID=2053492 RepID=UPI0035ADDC48